MLLRIVIVHAAHLRRAVASASLVMQRHAVLVVTAPHARPTAEFAHGRLRARSPREISVAADGSERRARGEVVLGERGKRGRHAVSGVVAGRMERGGVRWAAREAVVVALRRGLPVDANAYFRISIAVSVAGCAERHSRLHAVFELEQSDEHRQRLSIILHLETKKSVVPETKV